MEPPAPVRSPPASTSFPAVGCDVRLFFVYREGRVWEAERQEGQELTVIKFDPAGPVSAGKSYVLETTGGLKIEGTVDLDETGQATIAVVHDTVRSCLCCTDMGVPNPPFSSSPNGMTVRFSESDPHTIEATILAVEKRPTRSVVHLQMTSLPPYSACLGDRIMLSSGLSTWEATVIYFDNPDRRMDELSGTILDNRISIYVLDEHVPQGPIYLPHTKILVQPAPSGPANVTINHRGKGVSQRKRRSSAHEENEANKKKIKVAINGYRDIGRALARVALDSDDVDLVAINDPSIIDQVSCMFRDSKCDFEVKRGSSDILLFGEKEVNFFRESDPSAVPWYMARTKLVVTSRNSSQDEEVSYEKYASEYGRTSDVRLSGPLRKMLGTSTIPNNSWASILQIIPINSSDAKAVGDCFPLWKGKRLVSAVHFQGVDIIFELQNYPNYDVLPYSTLPSLDFACVVRWCFSMLSRLPASFCQVKMTQPSRR